MPAEVDTLKQQALIERVPGQIEALFRQKETAMKSYLLASAATVALVASPVGVAAANEITMCASLFIAADQPMDCSGHFTGKATMMQLAADGWEFMGDIARADKFILVFQR